MYAHEVYAHALKIYRRIADRYVPGTRHSVLVSPEEPRQLRFEAGPTIYFFTAAAGVSAFGLIFAGVGFGILIAMVRNILGLSQIGGDAQGTVIGLILIISLLLSNSAAKIRYHSFHDC